MSIIKSIKKLINSKRIFFTTPSHSQGKIIPPVIKNLIGLKAFKADWSEVDALDNLKNPESCILKSQENAAKIYNSQKTFYLTNGSTSGILALMLSVLTKGDKVLIARNAHESVFNGLVLSQAIPIWFLPDYDRAFSIFKGVTLKTIQEEYAKNKDIKALIITSPTYEGLCSEIREISAFCREKNIIFIVDEAHGALFPFSEKLPQSALALGADAVVHSLHKTTPALTGTALLHINKNSLINTDIVQKNLNLITTTSPSWLLIASIEGAIDYLNSKQGQKSLDELIVNIHNFIKQNSNFQFLSAKNHDITKLLIKKDNCSGEFISNFLSENNIEDELVTEKSVLCLCGIGTTKKKLARLSHVFEKFPKKISNNNNFENSTVKLPKMKLLPFEAHNAKYRIVVKKDAMGAVIAENITPYPPCVPILVAGEVIEECHAKYLPDNVKVII